MRGLTTPWRLIGAGIILLAAGACQPPAGGIASKSFSFDTPAGQNDALMLVGIRSTTPTDKISAIGFTWQRFDPQTDSLIASERSFETSVTQCTTQNKCYGSTQYRLIHVPAGAYALKAIWTFTPKAFFKPAVRRTTSLVGLETHQGLIGSTTAVPTNALVGSSLRYYFGKGEVVYIGDFLLDAARFPTRLVRIDRNDATAERVKMQLVNVQTAPLLFRQPNDRGGQPMVVQNLQGVTMPDLPDQPVLDSLDAATAVEPPMQ